MKTNKIKNLKHERIWPATAGLNVEEATRQGMWKPLVAESSSQLTATNVKGTSIPELQKAESCQQE